MKETRKKVGPKKGLKKKRKKKKEEEEEEEKRIEVER